MPINIQREFASVGLSSGGGVFAPPPPPSGRLEAGRALGRAQLRRFDRLAEAIDIETRTRVEQGQAMQRAGTALAVAAPRLREAAAKLEAERTERRQRHLAQTRQSQFLRDSLDILAQADAESGPSGFGLERRVRVTQRARIEALLADVDDEDLRRALSDRLALVAARNEIAARVSETRKERAFLRGELEKRNAAAVAHAARFRGTLQENLMRTAVADIRDSIDEGLLAPAEGERKIAAFRAAVLEKTIRADLTEDPLATARRFEAGDYDVLFSSDSGKTLVGAQIGGAVRTARLARAALIRSRIGDDVAAIEASGRGLPGLRVQIEALDDPQMLAMFERGRAEARAYHDTAQAIRTAIPEDARNAVMQFKPGPDAPDPDLQQRRYAAALRAWNDRERAMAADPALYVGQNMRVTGHDDLLAKQQALGIERPRLLTRTDAAARIRQLDAMSPVERIRAMQDIHREAGRHGTQLMEELVEAGLSMPARLAVLHGGNPGMASVLLDLARAEERGGAAALLKAYPAESLRALREASAEALKDVPDRPVPAGAAGADGAAEADDLRASVEALAATYVVKGLDPSRAAARAAGRLINDHVVHAESYAVPVAYDVRQVRRALRRYLVRQRRLLGSTAFDLAVPRDSEAAVAGERPGNPWVAALARNGTWRNTADGLGLMLLDARGRPVRRRNGAMLILRFDDLVRDAPTGIFEETGPARRSGTADAGAGP